MVVTSTSHLRGLGLIPRRNFLVTKMVCRNNGGGRSQGYVWGRSTVSCRKREIKGVVMV